MGVRAQNVKNLFADARSRTIIVITLIVIVIGILAGAYVFMSRGVGPATKAELQTTPGAIEGIPGSFDPTQQYAKLQEKANLERAKQAEKTGGSAIPTIIRYTRPGEGQVGVTPTGAPWQEGLGFQQLAQTQDLGPPKGLAIEQVKRSNCSAKELAEARKLGATVEELRQAGCTAEQLRAAGYNTDQLQKGGFSACDLLSGGPGLRPEALKNAGYSAGELRGVGFNACQLKRAGYSAEQLCKAGFTPQELKGVGYTDDQIRQACAGVQIAGVPVAPSFPGLPSGITPDSLRAAGCSPAALEKERKEGVSAEAIRRYVGCSVSQLKAGGYTAAQLRKAGFTAGQLRAAGFTPRQLKDAGYSAGDLLAAGYTPDQLKKAGYTPEQIATGEDQVNALGLPPGVTPALLKQRGCGVEAVRQAKAEGVSATEMRKIGCSAAQLKAGGYTAQELKNAGFTAAELKAAGFTAAQLKAAGFTAKQLKDAGFTAAQLKAAGFTAKQLKDAGFTAQELKDAGFTAGELKDAGFSAAELKAAGFSAKQLKDAGFTAGELKAAGFSAAALKSAGYTAEQLKDAGFTPNQLKDAGFSAGQLKAAGFSAQALKDAGFTASQLKDADFTARQLRNAGYSASELRQAGFTPSQLSTAGFSPAQLAQAGITPEQPTVTPTQAATPTAQEAEEQRQVAEQQLRQKVQIAQANMITQAGQLFSAWKPTTQAYLEGDKPKKGEAGAGGGPGGTEGGPGGSRGKPPIIRAGTIYFAVLDTAVNSDQPGPVMATIVAGRYKGAKLLGTMSTFPPHGKKVMLTFQTMTVKWLPSSISVDAVAIDPNTARTALSSKTNNHILLKYGTLFAASFLEGYGQAFLQSGQQIVSTAASTTSASPDLSPAGKIYVALGNVGNKFGSALQQLFNMPPTVKVYQGTALGILFMSDVAAPS